MSKIKKDRSLQLRMVSVLVAIGILTIGFASVVGFLIDSIIAAVVIVGILLGLQYYFSDRLALRSVNAKKVNAEDYPELDALVTRISQQADIAKPDIAVSKSNVPNAFATGRSKSSAVVCVTEGLLKELDTDELESVIAHEIAHIKNRDVAVMTISSFVVILSGMILRYSIYMNPNNNNAKGYVMFLFVSIITYVVGYLLIRLLSRYREHVADRNAANLTGKPLALVSALQKINSSVDNTPEKDLREISSANALMISPVGKSKVKQLMSTHPKTEKRIENLKEIAQDLENQ